jgi:hypothetical protein
VVSGFARDSDVEKRRERPRWPVLAALLRRSGF